MNGISDTLNMKSLEEIMAEEEELDEKNPIDDESKEIVESPTNSLMTQSDRMGKDHADDMENIKKEAFDTAITINEMARNIDISKAARLFEVGAQYLKIAETSSSAKRDAQLELIKIEQTNRKLSLEEMKTKHKIGLEVASVNENGDAILVETRNDVLAALRIQNTDND